MVISEDIVTHVYRLFFQHIVLSELKLDHDFIKIRFITKRLVEENRDILEYFKEFETLPKISDIFPKSIVYLFSNIPHFIISNITFYLSLTKSSIIIGTNVYDSIRIAYIFADDEYVITTKTEFFNENLQLLCSVKIQKYNCLSDILFELIHKDRV